MLDDSEYSFGMIKAIINTSAIRLATIIKMVISIKLSLGFRVNLTQNFARTKHPLNNLIPQLISN